MTTLADLLNELEIDIPEDKPAEPEIKLDDLDESHKKYFETLSNQLEETKNELAKRELVIETLKSQKPEDPKPKDPDTDPDDNDDELSVLKNEIKTLKDMINGKSEEQQKADLANRVAKFAEKHSDIVRYAKDMDNILVHHPTLAGDIPTLYELAKKTAERREKKAKQTSETSGAVRDNVVDIQQGKSIAEAFELAQKKMGGNR